MTMLKTSLTGACLAAALACAAPALATPTTTWNLSQNCSQIHGSGSACIDDGSSHVTTGNEYQWTSGGLHLTGSAYHSSSSSNLGSKDFLGLYSGYGLGVGDLPAPRHAVDNDIGYDFIVFELPTGANFDKLQIILSSFGETEDMNATILYGTPTAALGIGTSPSVLQFAGLTINNLLNDGFQEKTTTNLLNKSGNQEVDVMSSSVINYVIVAASLTPGRHEDDYFKVNSITAIDSPPVGAPEPATLALLGSGIMGLTVMRRRKAAAAKA